MNSNVLSIPKAIEIEELLCAEFDNELKTRSKKKSSAGLFYNLKLYKANLSFPNRSIPIESMIRGMWFHRYKTHLEIYNSREEYSKPKELVTLEIYNSSSNELYSTCLG